MLEQHDSGSPVHFPANPEKFVFDKEVAQIFPDMASRSIPMYREFHALHASMLHDYIEAAPHTRVLDVGASRGAFGQALAERYGTERLKYYAIDNSDEMVRLMARDLPWAEVIANVDIVDSGFETHFSCQFDIVCASYILQFLPKDRQFDVLRVLVSYLRPGGILILGHKEAGESSLYQMAHNVYLDWRVMNGYSRQEIEAKTKALKNSMFPMSHADLVGYLRDEMSEVQELSRWTVFSTLMARK